MSESRSPAGSRRRADAERNIAAILDAAVALLEQRPDASMSDIADAAGVTRQTVYAHYPSRDALLTAVLERALAEGVAALDAARLEEGTPAEALGRFLHAGWDSVESYVRIFETVTEVVTPGELAERHDAVMRRLHRLIRRGQRTGEFDRTVPARWLVATAIALIHAAAQEVSAGRLSSTRAREVAVHTVMRAVTAG